MKTTINRYLFASTLFDSGSLGVLTSVIHQFNEPGLYQAVVRIDDVEVRAISFEVRNDSGNMQLDIDLGLERSAVAKNECDCAKGAGSQPTVSSKGYVLFHTSRGTGGYSVRVGNTERGQTVFDSQNLGPGDLFALSLMEPTTYVMRNSKATAKGEIVVTFSPKDGPRLRSLKSEMIEVAKDRFSPAQVRVTSTQGLVFRVAETARIVIEHKEQGKRKGEPPQARRFSVK